MLVLDSEDEDNEALAELNMRVQADVHVSNVLLHIRDSLMVAHKHLFAHHHCKTDEYRACIGALNSATRQLVEFFSY